MSAIAAPMPLAARENYRQLLAAALPALMLAYVLIVSPLLYGGVVSADLAAAGATPVAESFLLNKLVYPGVFALGLVLFLAERSVVARANGALLLTIGAFLTLCWASAAWSMVPGRVIGQIGLASLAIVGLGAAAATAGAPGRIMRLLFWVMAAALAINLVVVLTRPPGPIGHEGIYDHKNTLGAVAAVGIIFAVWGLLQSGRERFIRYASFVLLPATLLILWRSESKTSLGFVLIAPIIGAALIFGIRRMRASLPLMLVGLAVLAGVATWFAGQLGYTLGDVSKIITGDPTFTGRTDLWVFAADHIAARPWLGWGFRSFWQIGAASPQLQAAPGFVQVAPDGHDGYIDLLLQVGVVGLGLFIAMILALGGRLGRIADRTAALGFLVVTLLVFTLLHSLLESTWLAVLDPVGALFLVLLTLPFGLREDAP